MAPPVSYALGIQSTFHIKTLTVYHCHLMLSIQLYFFQPNFIYFKMEKKWLVRGTSHSLLKSTDELTHIFIGSDFIALPQVAAFQQRATSQTSKSCLIMSIPTHSTSVTWSISALLVQEHPVHSKPNLPATSIHFSYIWKKKNQFCFQEKNLGQISHKIPGQLRKTLR